MEERFGLTFERVAEPPLVFTAGRDGERLLVIGEGTAVIVSQEVE